MDSTRAKLKMALMVAGGGVAVWSLLDAWAPPDPIRFLCYLLLAVAGSAMKVKLPGLDGEFSLSLFFVLIAMAELSFAQTVVIACLSAAAPLVWEARERLDIRQAAFRTVAMTVSVAVTYPVFYAAGRAGGEADLPILLTLAACASFGLTSVLLAVLTGPGEDHPWPLPYCLVTGCVAGLISLANLHGDWRVSMFALPAVYLLCRYYSLYTGWRASDGGDAEKHDRTCAWPPSVLIV